MDGCKSRWLSLGTKPVSGAATQDRRLNITRPYTEDTPVIRLYEKRMAPKQLTINHAPMKTELRQSF